MAYPRSEANSHGSSGTALAVFMFELIQKKNQSWTWCALNEVVNTSKIHCVCTLPEQSALATRRYQKCISTLKKLTRKKSCLIWSKKFALSIQARSEVKILSTQGARTGQKKGWIHQNDDGSESDGVDSNCRVNTSVPDPKFWSGSLDPFTGLRIRILFFLSAAFMN